MGLGVLSIREFRTERNIFVQEQTFYSLSPKHKWIMKGNHDEGEETIKSVLTEELRSIPPKSFQLFVEVW